MNILAGVTVKFQRNTANTPVYFLATGDVTIAGVVDVSGENGTDGNTGNIAPVPGGKGGPGGFDGGYGGEPGSEGIDAKLPGNGLGAGGGPSGSYCSIYYTGGKVSEAALEPIELAVVMPVDLMETLHCFLLLEAPEAEVENMVIHGINTAAVVAVVAAPYL